MNRAGGSRHLLVAKTFVVSEMMKNALPQGAILAAKMTPRPSTSPISTHAPYPETRCGDMHHIQIAPARTKNKQEKKRFVSAP